MVYLVSFLIRHFVVSIAYNLTAAHSEPGSMYVCQIRLAGDTAALHFERYYRVFLHHNSFIIIIIIISPKWQFFNVAGYLKEERRRWPVITASPRGQHSK